MNAGEACDAGPGEIPADDPLVLAGGPLYGANTWPRGQPEFRQAMVRYWAAMTELCDDLLGAFAIALGLDETALLPYFDKPLSNITLLHYPPEPPATDPDQMGIHPHRDSDAFTILLPDPVGALEVRRRDGAWIKAPTIPGTFVVNIGNMMECWTAGRFVSAPHRVVDRTGAERYSIAFFAIPAYDTVIRPPPVGRARGERTAEGEIRVGPFLQEIYASNWA